MPRAGEARASDGPERHIGAGVGWVALAAWALARASTRGALVHRVGLAEGGLTYLAIDTSWLLLALGLLALLRWSPSPRAVWAMAVVLALLVASQGYAQAASRYFRGDARAWDLANYVQPLWRAAHGLSMASATYDDRPVWADHGAFAMIAFAPLARLGDDPAVPVLAAQALLVGGSVLATTALARALGLAPLVALGATCVMASSRALASATRFDFHAECALGVLLLGGIAAWTPQGPRARPYVALALTLLAALLRDIAAMTVAMFWTYAAITATTAARRKLALGGAAVAALIAVIDVSVLPRVTGWPSYVAMHGAQPLDLGLAVQTTLLRCLSSFGLGWLHPLAWLSGAPWIVAAAASPKLAVKGIDFQYGFLFVPVAMAGALYALAWLGRWRPRWLGGVACGWAILAVAVNAPLPQAYAELPALSARHAAARAALAAHVPDDASVVADACAAPYVMARAALRVACRLDVALLEARGIERWDAPVPIPPAASHYVLHPRCPASGECMRAQLTRARALGFGDARQVDRFVVLRRVVMVPALGAP